MKKKWKMPLWMEKWMPLIDDISDIPNKDRIETAMNKEFLEQLYSDTVIVSRTELLIQLHKKRII